MRIILVDDEQFHLTNLQNMVRAALEGLGLEAQSIRSYTSAPEFLSSWQPGDADILILDIYMGDHHGVDIARQIREKDPDVALAFCTSSNEFAAESYEVGAGYYLQKPISMDKIQNMLKRLDLRRILRNRILRLPNGAKCPLRSIVFTEYSNHTVTFHLQDVDPITAYMSQGEAEKLLLHYNGFCVVNKGCIVHFAQVKKLTDGGFLMQNGETVPIARRRAKEVGEAYNRFRFERLNEEVQL